MEGRALRLISTLCLVACAAASARAAPAPACRPFILHPGAIPPRAWRNVARESDTEEELLTQVVKLKGQVAFSDAYRSWVARGADGMTKAARGEWLSCVLFYLRGYTDRTGTPIWTPLVDGVPSRVLLPVNDDIDGDGTPNLLDPAPFDARVAGAPNPVDVPAHLRDSRPRIAELQNRLYHEFGILAVNHTDRHSRVVLESLLLLLERGLPREVARRIKSFRVLYAFGGHDAEFDMGAYHAQLRAISIGGISVYRDSGHDSGHDSGSAQRLTILAALAHELGHAFLLENLSPAELLGMAETFGGWRRPAEPAPPRSFFSRALFTARPTTGPHGEAGLVSSYAATNPHEWFADTFAAALLGRLGRAGLLGRDWKQRFVVEPSNGRYWVDYNKVPSGFSHWLQSRFLSVELSPRE